MECKKQILAGISLESVEAIRSFQKIIARKYMNAIAKGKARKLRIISKLILDRK